jgi:hypothetical protein
MANILIKSFHITILPKTDPNTLARELEYIWKAGTKLYKGRHYTGYPTSPGVSTKLFNVNSNALQRMTKNLADGFALGGKKALQYGSFLHGCMGQTSRALWGAGVLTLPNLPPLMLNFQLAARQAGIYSLPHLTNR